MPDQITTEDFADHMDAFEQRLGARASRSDRRIEAIDSRLDSIDGRLDAIDIRLDVIDGRLRGLIETIGERLAQHDDVSILNVTTQPPASVEPAGASETTIDKANGVIVDQAKATRSTRGRGAKTARETARAPRVCDGPARRERQRRSRT